MSAIDYTVELENGVETYNNATVRAMERLEKEGLHAPHDRPKMHGSLFDGRLPANVASLPNKDLAEYYSAMCAHTDFVTSKRVQARALLVNAEQRLELTKAKIRRTKIGTIQERDDSVLCDQRYVEANADWLEARTYYDLLDSLYDAAVRDMKFISRLVETKKLDVELGRRDRALNAGPKSSFPRG